MDGLISLALAKKEAKKYTDTKFTSISGGFNYLGSVSSIEDLPLQANSGDEYTVGNQGTYVYDGQQWVPNSKIGPAGPQGPQGIPGPQGEPGRDGDEVNAYAELTKIKDYLYETYYTECDYSYAKKYFETRRVPVTIGACSAVKKGNFYGRNLDWTYDESAEFIIRMPRIGNRYASIGVAGTDNTLTNSFVDSGAFSKNYKLLPFRTLDGINEYGVTVNVNVVPNDKGINKESIPLIEKRETICNLMVVRYILDHFQSADEAVSYIRDYVAIYPLSTMEEMGYESHWMVADKQKTFALEIVENQIVVIDITDKPYLTNFYLDGVTFNEDGSVYYPAISDATHNAKITNGITDNGCGLERYVKILNNYALIPDTSEGMLNFMYNELKYTKAYNGGDPAGIGEWNTEFVGIDNLTVASAPAAFAPTIAASHDKFLNRSRDPSSKYYGTWQSTHTVTYDLNNKSLSIIIQEDNQILYFDYNLLKASIGVISVPSIKITPSMVISMDPFTIQLDAAQNNIIVNDNNLFINFDTTPLGASALGSSTFIKSKSNVPHEFIMVSQIVQYNTRTHLVTNGTENTVIYNDTTRQGVYSVIKIGQPE